MEDRVFEDIEIAPLSVIKQAAYNFAAAVADTPQFKTFEQAAYAFRHQPAAQQAMQAYKQKQLSLRPFLLLNAVSDEQRTELERLEREFVSQPTVMEYLQSQTELSMLCQSLGDSINESIGINFAIACGARCCG